MNCYIQIKNGVPFEHPIMEDNFRQAFPDIDVNNLPPEFARFTRKERVVEGTGERYQTMDSKYVQNGDAWEDEWHFRDMNEEEKEMRDAQELSNVQSYIDNIKSVAKRRLVNIPEEYKVLWQNWIDAMDAYVLTDPYNWRNKELDNWPFNPLKLTEDGSWVLAD